MKSALFVVLSAVLLSGCASRDFASTQDYSVFKLDETGERRAPSKPRLASRPQSQSASNSTQLQDANASVETTSAIRSRRNDDDLDRRQIAELSKFKANTPEWWAAKKQIDSEQNSQNENMRKRLTICRGC